MPTTGEDGKASACETPKAFDCKIKESSNTCGIKNDKGVCEAIKVKAKKQTAQDVLIEIQKS